MSNRAKYEILPLCLGGLVAIIYVFPWLWFGESGYIRIHDNLDGMFSQYYLLKNDDFLFDSNMAMVGPIFDGGLPRISYPTEISAVSWFFIVLEPFQAYVTYHFSIAFFAFTGMWVLLKQILPQFGQKNLIIIAGASACFASLPFYTWAAGPALVPWIVFVLLKGWQGKLGLIEWAVIIVAPFFITFQLTGIFVAGFAILFLVFAVIRNNLNGNLLFGVGLLLTMILLTGYRMISFAISGTLKSHREDFALGLSYEGAVHEFYTNLVQGTISAPSLHWQIVVPFFLFTLAVLIHPKTPQTVLLDSDFQKRIKVPQFTFVFVLFCCALILLSVFSSRVYILTDSFIEIASGFIWICSLITLAAAVYRYKLKTMSKTKFGTIKLSSDMSVRILIILAVFVFVKSMFLGLWVWSGLDFLRETIPLLKQINLGRVVYFQPVVWMLIFAFSMSLTSRLSNAKYLLYSILALQLTVNFYQHEHLRERRISGVSFQAFFAKELFEDIENAIGKPKQDYRVGNIGIHPSIAQYNGFRTADAYLSLYPHAYKKKFREAVASEFSRRDDLLSYFDDWGNRAYFFSSEILCPRGGSICRKGEEYKIEKLLLDMNPTRALGVDYLFSIARIGNADELGLIDLGVFNDRRSAWEIRVYKVRKQS